ncbi:hypothetical protein CC86DRAFT_293500 [Ophiobolus disseminans]|uniref:Uncharacterized protein n=1 Tax=Ophiobolus disseminans TaxID=1469910 RepID=A0A6A6ZZS5_9PLEO|nr:hypothetical protein CC86DRAFT_293500 [Ophiobolus disseminans]
MNEPAELTRIDQLSRKASFSSFAYKEDPIHWRILDLLYFDTITDMTDSARRGLANSLHFLVVRDMYDAIKMQRIAPSGISLLYEYDVLKKLHRSVVKITEASQSDAESQRQSVSMVGKWIETQSQALISLRTNVDLAIYRSK